MLLRSLYLVLDLSFLYGQAGLFIMPRFDIFLEAFLFSLEDQLLRAWVLYFAYAFVYGISSFFVLNKGADVNTVIPCVFFFSCAMLSSIPIIKRALKNRKLSAFSIH